QIGAPALVWLARDVVDHPAGSDERIAWAMAHVAASGGAPAVAAMATGDSIGAPLAAKALELARDVGDRAGAEPDAAGSAADRDLSVNHAFSRQFFEALDRSARDRDGDADAANQRTPVAAES